MMTELDIWNKEWLYQYRLQSYPHIINTGSEKLYEQTILSIGPLGIDWSFRYDGTVSDFVYGFKTIENFMLFKLTWLILLAENID